LSEDKVFFSSGDALKIAEVSELFFNSLKNPSRQAVKN